MPEVSASPIIQVTPPPVSTPSGGPTPKAGAGSGPATQSAVSGGSSAKDPGAGGGRASTKGDARTTAQTAANNGSSRADETASARDTANNPGASAGQQDGAFNSVLEGRVAALKTKLKSSKDHDTGDAAANKPKGDSSGADAANGQAGQNGALSAWLLPGAAQVVATDKTTAAAAVLKGIAGEKAGGGDARSAAAKVGKGDKGAADIAVAGKGLPGASSDNTTGSSQADVARVGAKEEAARQSALKADGSLHVNQGKKEPSAQTVKPDTPFSEKLAKLEPSPQAAVTDPKPGAGTHTEFNPHARIDGAVGTQTAQATSPSAANMTVDTRVGSPGWDGALGQKVTWMATHNHQSAELHLNPPNLGPLEVRVTVSHDQASAMFVSHHGAVRDAIESALPRLREMLADNGLTLGNVMVGSQSFAQQQQNFTGGQAQGWGGASLPVGGESGLFPMEGGRTVMLGSGDGLVDTFV